MTPIPLTSKNEEEEEDAPVDDKVLEAIHYIGLRLGNNTQLYQHWIDKPSQARSWGQILVESLLTPKQIKDKIKGFIPKGTVEDSRNYQCVPKDWGDLKEYRAFTQGSKITISAFRFWYSQEWHKCTKNNNYWFNSECTDAPVYSILDPDGEDDDDTEINLSCIFRE